MKINNSYIKIKTIQKFKELLEKETQLYIGGEWRMYESGINRYFDIRNDEIRYFMDNFTYYYKGQSKEIY